MIYEANKMISKCVRTYLAPYKYTACSMCLWLVEEICLVRNIQYINYGMYFMYHFELLRYVLYISIFPWIPPGGRDPPLIKSALVKVCFVVWYEMKNCNLPCWRHSARR